MTKAELEESTHLARLVLWMRSEGIAWSELTVGDIKIVGGDTRLEPPDDKRTLLADEARPRGIYAEYGPPPEAVMKADARQTAIVEEE